jgi:DNA-binding transcriptional MerR regulator
MSADAWETFTPERRPARPAPRDAGGVLTGGELCRLAGMPSSQLLHWCRAGVFGPGQPREVGSGYRRRFSQGDVKVALVCRRLSSTLADAGFPGGAPWALLAEVAEQVRAGADVVRVRLAEHVELIVEVTDLRTAS